MRAISKRQVAAATADFEDLHTGPESGARQQGERCRAHDARENAQAFSACDAASNDVAVRRHCNAADVSKRRCDRQRKASRLRRRRFWCKTFVRSGGYGNGENRFTRSGGVAPPGMRAVHWCPHWCCARRNDCGEDQGLAEAGRLFQFVLGREGGQVVAGNRQVGHGISVPERAAGGRRFERHWAGSRAVGRDTDGAVRKERARRCCWYKRIWIFAR